MDETEGQQTEPLSAVERAIHHFLAAGRKYAAEVMSSIAQRATRWLIWIVAALVMLAAAIIGVVFLLVGLAQLVHDAWPLFGGFGYLVVGFILLAIIALCIALAKRRLRK